jgi:hypothetical protein
MELTLNSTPAETGMGPFHSVRSLIPERTPVGIGSGHCHKKIKWESKMLVILMKTLTGGGGSEKDHCWFGHDRFSQHLGFLFAVTSGPAAPTLVAVPAPAEVQFATAQGDVESHWKKNWPAETILEIKSAGEGTSSLKVINNLGKVPCYSVPAKVRVKRTNGSVATFSVWAIYKKPAQRWIFEDIATGNVQQEKASGQDEPPFVEAEAAITKGWVDKFSSQGDTDTKILKIHSNPVFKAYGKGFSYTCQIDLEYATGRTRYQCQGQEVDLVKENAAAPWTFRAVKNMGGCQGQRPK